MNYTDQDWTARNKIRTNTSSNYFVEAGAGSGKTSVLVDRMAAMVENGMDISKICAITFTKAAAGEFYARFYKKLSESQSENARQALQHIDLCFMGTIDSFCSMILSEHPAKAGIPSDARIISDEEKMQLYKQEYIRIQNGEYGSELREKSLLFKKSFYDHLDVFLYGVDILSQNKNADFRYTKLPGKDVDAYFHTRKAEILNILKNLKAHPEAQPQKGDKNNAAAWKALEDSSDIIFDSWSENIGNVQKLMKTLEGIRISPDFDIALLGPGYEHFFIPHMTRSRLSHYKVNVEADPFLCQALKNYKMTAAMDFIVPAASAISENMRKQGNLTFSDYLIYLRDLLKKDAETGGKLIAHIYNRHSYFLIDEFQDTNPVQAEIFFYLTALHPESDWMKCIPKPGSLFIVGDPKQSIYRFRGADVSAFLRVRSLFENPQVGEVLYLTRNFRSSDPMCQWFNHTFTRLLPEDTEIQSKFNEIPTGEKCPYMGTLSGVYKYPVVIGRSLEDSEDSQMVADIIRRIVAQPEVTIQDRDENGTAQSPRTVKYNDIMLITPGKTHLGLYTKALSDYGIPFRIEGKIIFAQCPALITLSALFSAVSKPFDKQAEFSAKHLFGCNIDAEKLLEYRKRAKAMSPAAVFNMLLEEECVFEKSGTENAEYVYFALELLRSAEVSGNVISLTEGAEFTQNLIDDETAQERCIQLKPNANCVHIANLHKVKGLEAPIVILAAPKKSLQKPSYRIDYSSNPPEGWIFELPGKLRTTDLDAEEESENAVLQSESVRLLYVAATRAANALIIADGIKREGSHSESNPWLPLLAGTSAEIFKTLPPFCKTASDVDEILHISDLYQSAEEASILNNRSSEEESYEIIRPSAIAVKSKLASEEEYDETVADRLHDAAQKKKNPALTGTLVHKLMEWMVSSGNHASLSEIVNEICLDYGIEDPTYADLLLSVGTTMQNGGYPQNGTLPQDILSELLSADEVHCEVPFCYSQGDNFLQISNGVMDVVYRKDGFWHIVDYKTNADASDLDEHYQAQLDAYTAAFHVMTGESADAKVYHIAI